MSGNLSTVNAVTQFINATQATWNNVTIPVPQGMVVYASDTTVIKMGDGSTLYANLPSLFTLNQIINLSNSLATNTAAIAAINATLVGVTEGSITNAAITAGTINNAVIGGSTPAAGNFTTLGATGAVNSKTGQFLFNGNVGFAIYGTPGSNPTTIVGSNAGAAQSTTTGGFSTFLGDSAGQFTLSSASENTFVGSAAGRFNVNGGQNFYGGTGCGWFEQSGENVAIGCDCYRNVVSAGANTAVGQDSQRNGSGFNNTSIGQGALEATATTILISGTQTTGDVVTLTFNAPASALYGYAALVNVPVSVTITAGMTTAQLTTALITAINATIPTLLPTGTQASGVSGMITMTFAGTQITGSLCVITASVSGAATEIITITPGFTGNGNVAVGVGAMNGPNLQTASSNTAVGFNALSALTTANGNVGVGGDAGQLLTSGVSNTLIGSVAGKNLTTPSYNVAVGSNTLTANITGSAITAVGAFALGNNIGTGQYSVAVGYGALQGAVGSTNNGNTAVGSLAGNAVTTASSALFAGYRAGQAVTSASNITLLGVNAGLSITTGGLNTIIGANVSSTTLTTGTGNIIIGSGSTSSSLDTALASTSNTINIGGIFTATGIGTPATAVSAISGNLAVGGPSGPTWSTGSGVPSGNQPVGSLYSNNTGTFGAQLYVSAGSGIWNSAVIKAHARVVLTQAQILALNTTPIPIIPAPGASTIITIDSWAAALNFGTSAYSAVAMSLNYINAAGPPTGVGPSSALVSATTTSYQNGRGSTVSAVASTLVVNEAIVVTAASAITGGDGTLSIDVWYTISSL